MKQRRKWWQRLLPVLVFVCLCFVQNSFAQDDYNDNNNNNNNYDNSDEALIQPEQDVNYNTFHDELSPYGNWMNYPGYGNVWVANIPGFRPYYTGGHWAYTRFGWTWVSDYNWGWAPFHYGRWAFDAAYGWFWVPAYTWGPAWVSWRTGSDYYGWAPLGPGLSVGLNVGIGIPANNWVFLPHRYMGYRSINPYYVSRQQNITIIRNTTIINNTNVYNNHRYVVGPDRRDVERYSGQRIQQQNIYVTNHRNDVGQYSNGIHMYNPNAGNRINNNNNRQDNIRQQPFQNDAPQQNNRINRTQDNRQQPDYQNGNNNPGNRVQDNQQREQREQNMQNRMQQQQNDQRNQQMEQQRQQRMQQQMDNQRQQQMQQRQQNDMQRQQQMQQRQQMMQQRQQQFPQRQENRNNNQPFPQRNNNGGANSSGGGRRRN